MNLCIRLARELGIDYDLLCLVLTQPCTISNQDIFTDIADKLNVNLNLAGEKDSQRNL